MANPVEIVKELDRAFREKDEAAYRNLLHPQYTFRGPCMTLNSRDEAVEFMKSGCPFKFHNENCIVVSEGDKVVHIFDWVVEAPFQGTFRMAEYFTLDNGKIRSAELFYDTSGFPKEFMEAMQKEKCAV